MLGKLIKYELKASARTFLPLYFALCIMSLMVRFSSIGASNSFEILASGIGNLVYFLYTSLIFAILIITIWIILQRFFKNLLGNEGYLMFTLPVSTDKIIFSKIIASTIWILLSFLAITLSMLILFFNSAMFDGLSEILNEIFSRYFYETMPYIFEYIIIVILGMWSFIALNYSALSLGHLLGRNKILSSIGAYIVLSIATDWVTKIVHFVLDNPFIFNWVYSLSSNMQMHLYLISTIVGLAVATAVYFSISNWVLKNKLNLE